MIKFSKQLGDVIKELSGQERNDAFNGLSQAIQYQLNFKQEVF
jgi:hypothetical protein